MKHSYAYLTVLMLVTIGLSGCQATQGRSNNELIGGGAGAILGGIVGAQVGSGSGRLWATGAGVLLGALVGSEIGGSLDPADRAYASNAHVEAQQAPIGRKITWNNPESGNHGSVTPIRDGYDQSGEYCREYQQNITVGGRQETGYGTACLRPDGQWEIVDRP